MTQIRHILIAALLLALSASAAQAAPTVNFLSPAPNALVDATEEIRVNVVSAQPLQSIEITDGTTTLPMIQNGSLYQVFFPFPQPYATPVTMTVTVTDVLNDTGTAQRSYIVDHRPVVTVTAPLDYTVGRPNVRVTATCTDDDPAGCDSIKFSGPNGSTVGATIGGSSVDHDLIVNGHVGDTIEVSVSGRDSAGQKSVGHDIKVHIDPSPDIINIVDMPGKILDFDATRIVYTYQGNIVLYDRNTAATSQLSASPTSATHLVSDGVVFVHDPNTTVPDIRLWHWQSNGTVNDLGHPSSSPRIAGDYVIWSTGFTITQRQLSTGQETIVATNAGNTNNGVAEDGSVCYWSSPVPNDIYFYSGGSTTQLTNDPAHLHAYCSTDGTRVIYGRRTPQCPPTGCLWDILLYDGSTHTVLSPSYGGFIDQRSWRMVGSWLAYAKVVGSLGQVFLLSPSGQETQISNFSVSSVIDSLSANGEATFQADSMRWIYQPGLPAGHVNSPLGIPRWINGKLEVAIGRSLFAYAAPSAGDAGVGDSGIDAGVPQDSGLDAAADGAPDAGITPDAAIDSAVADAAIADTALADTTSIDVALPSDTSTIADAGPASDALTQDMPNDAGSPEDGAGGGCAVSQSPSLGFVLVLLLFVTRRRPHER